MSTPRALVLRAPGINCDRETAHACRLAGFETHLLHINELIAQPERLLEFHFLVIPGGFSYGDDLGAGTLLAKNLTIHLGPQLRRFIDEGWPVLGICNGFQTLVRAGLLPGFENTQEEGHAERSEASLGPEGETLRYAQGDSYEHQIASLTNNASAQFECRWVTLSLLESSCIFTRGINSPIELPVAHGEGQFVLVDEGGFAYLQTHKQIPIVYTMSTRQASPSPAAPTFSYTPTPYPDNPNGSAGNIAGICNARGNVFGLMPHPERYVQALQHPERRDNHGAGDGLLIFKNAFDYVREMLEYVTNAEREKGERATARVPALPNTPAHTMTTDLGGDVSVHCKGGGGDDAGWGPLRSPSNGTSRFPGSEGGGGDDGRGPLRSPSNDTSHFPVSGGADDGRSPSPVSHIAPSITTSYAASGVNIAAADAAKEMMREAVRGTQGAQVLAGMGAFAGVFALHDVAHMHRPALVASTDGVGTKTLIATQTGRFEGIGYDLVHHSVNDLLTQGARPLFFMDYLAMGKLDAQQAAAIVRSVAGACQGVSCALLGGETAEMPDVYLPGAFDLAGTIVGIVEQDALLNRPAVQPGDVLLGLPSSGLHTNGYSLARRVFADYPLDTVFPELGEPLVDTLLRPHRCYLREIQMLHEYPPISIKGMAHITGGGFEGNISRILPPGIQAVIQTGAWQVPPLFELMGHLGNVERSEMYRAFNMGVGMVLICSSEAANEARHMLPELLAVGILSEGEGVVLV